MLQTINHLKTLALVLAVLLAASCDSADADLGTEGPDIPPDSSDSDTFVARDGLRLSWEGPDSTGWIELTSLGWLRDSFYHETPSVSQKLDLALQDSLLSLFADLEYLPRPGYCIEVTSIVKTSYVNGQSVTGSIDRCSPDLSDPKVARTHQAWNSVVTLNAVKHRQLDPWIGVQPSVEILGSSGVQYDSLNVLDSLKVAVHLENQTSQPRTVYFKNEGLVKVDDKNGLIWGEESCHDAQVSCVARAFDIPPHKSLTVVEHVPVSQLVRSWFRYPYGRRVRVSPMAFMLEGQEIEYLFVVRE